MPGFVKKCPFVRQKVEDDVKVLDYRHCSLHDIPSEVFNRERTLEELYADFNQIRDLPRELFYCHGLRKLSVSDNEITSIPPAISSLANLEELDISKNGIIDVPENIKGCKYLRSIDASVNPLGKLPEGITHLANLTHLYLNDTFLDFLPGSFGRMVTLKILELRENHLKTLPRSFSRLTELQRLDIGNNELSELSEVIGGLNGLLELWCDNNQITTISNSIGNLKQLMFLDASNNQLQHLPAEIEGCLSLADLHLTSNNLVELPDSIGNLNNLTTLKVDENQLTCLPKTIGGLSSLSELNVSANDLQELPTSIGLLRNLRTFYADENMLQFVPAELGSCSGITVLSLRGNKLTYIPDELGRIPGLRVLNLSDNLLRSLPFSIVKLKELQALWLTENQTHPLIPLQSEYEADTGRKILTCYLLPQGQTERNDERDPMGDNDSFHASMWDEERLRRQQIHFAFVDGPDEEGRLVRCPTPYPKEMKEKVRHARNLALRQKISLGDNDGQVRGAEGSSGVKGHSTQLAGTSDEMSEHSDGRLRETRFTKPTSPRLPETHRLYKFDKEKLMKDKVRMQHHLSVPDFSGDSKISLKEAKLGDKKAHVGETSLSRNSGSVPDLTATSTRDITPAATTLATSTSPSLTYDELYSKHIAHRHKGRRSRRMRDYDSDTGYRSDGESIRFSREVRKNSHQETSSEIFSVQSQPLPYYNYHHHHLRGREREGLGYASDIGGYTGGNIFPTANAAAAAFQKNNHHLGHHPAASLPFDLNTIPQSSAVVNNSSNIYPFSPNSAIRPYSPCYSEPRQYSSRLGNSSMPQFLRPSSDYTSHYSKTSNSSDRLTPTVNSGPTVPVTSLQRQTNLGPPSQVSIYPDPHTTTSRPNLQSKSERNLSLQYSHQSATPSPHVFQKGNYTNQNSPRLNQSLHTATGGYNTPNSVIMIGHRGDKPHLDSHTFLPSQTADLCQALAAESIYSPPQSHQRSDTKSPGPRTSRLPSDASSSHVYQPHSIMKTSSPVTGVSQHILLSDVQSRAQTSPCGFHGSSRYSDLPSTPREKLIFSDYTDVDHFGQSYYREDHLGKTRSKSPFQCNQTSRSGSSSSQLGSASQVGLAYPAGGGSRRHDQSNSSDSRSDVHNYSSFRESPSSGIASYVLTQPSSRQNRSYDHYPGTFDTGNCEDMIGIPNQEQSSQVSSSTDSGYSHGHLVYDSVGDYSKSASKKYSVQGGRGSHGSEILSVPLCQRQTLGKGTESIHSKDVTYTTEIIMAAADSSIQECTDQFHVTIHKNPGLGFSIAGGIGGQGNPYKANDIGIFVTKVIPEGPASKLLQPGDKILEVNKVDFQAIEHNQAVAVLRMCSTVDLLVERIQKVNLV